MGKISLWILAGVIVLLSSAVTYGALTRDSTNARVAEDIRQNPDGDRAARSMLLTLEDGTMYPVNYLVEDGKVFMGIDGLWWRVFVDDAKPVTMFIKGQTYTGSALAVLDDPAYVKDIFSRLRPTVPKWLPDALNGKLVVITLDEPLSVNIQELKP